MISIPAKPPGSQWTDEQWQAIVTRGDSVLVAAAAGSGKTAVLIERILRMITSEDDPVDVDRLLVATFTKAAADEMKSRMRAALEKKLAEGADSPHLRRQLALIHRASFTTIHSFCMEIISKYYYKAELDPGFRVANEVEAELLRQDVLEDLFERHYSESEQADPFWGLLDRYGGERGDGALFALVSRLYDFSRSHPFPDRWLHDSAHIFSSFNPNSDDPLVRQLLQDTMLALEGVSHLLGEALAGARSPGGPAAYTDTIESELAMAARVRSGAASGDWQQTYEMFQTIEFGRLKAAKKDETDEQVVERVKSLRDKAKKELLEIRDQLYAASPDQFAQQMRECAPYMEKLTQLTIEFGQQYKEAKKAKRLVDFADLEHYALAILCEGVATDGTLIPTAAALAYREYYVQVLIDEYQDTNQVQEAILSLISRSDPGNRFMVGDVKQSIYRFRLADPGIFLGKYKGYRELRAQDKPGGLAIDLARNFRSRQEVVDSVNDIFRQTMDERAVEVEYDRDAELVCGAQYPESPNDQAHTGMDVIIVHRGVSEDRHGAKSDTSDEHGESDLEDGSEIELETVELEARMAAMQIRQWLGLDGNRAFQVTDKRDSGAFRDAEFRDIVILLRATTAAAPIYVDQLRLAGIPSYAELSTGYFEAVEVDVMLSLLKVIDNPLQDIPLAGVLRSPLVGLSADELARIRLGSKASAYYEALVHYTNNDSDKSDKLRDTLNNWLDQLGRWRLQAREGSLSDLLWQIYRETGYYDYVGGLPGGQQRQANLKALYDRCRQFEATSLRGLFRFLRFIKRLQDSGGDLGAAKAVGEQDNVVRIMSIHKSKGLEFPIVLVAGMGKRFNQRDLTSQMLLHKELGFGPLVVDPALQVSYPSVAHHAIRRRLRMESLAEEMRILYVALTRAKEKLTLLGTTRNVQDLLARWGDVLSHDKLKLPAHTIHSASSFFDWVGPAVIRHPDLREIRQAWGLGGSHLVDRILSQSRVKLAIVSQDRLGAWQEAAVGRSSVADDRLARVARLEPVDVTDHSGLVLPGSISSESERIRERVDSKLSWAYPHASSSTVYSKTSVTEIKRMRERELAGIDRSDLPPPVRPTASRRPAFIEDQSMSAAERGTIYHAIMQQLPLAAVVDEEVIRSTISRMMERELVRKEQVEHMDARRIALFFRTSIGQRLLRSQRVQRELPFSYGLSASELHPEAAKELEGDIVLVQGVIDCLFEEDDDLVLLDYKTDKIRTTPEQTADKYRAQLDLYARAISAITGKNVKEKALYFFDGGHVVVL